LCHCFVLCFLLFHSNALYVVQAAHQRQRAGGVAEEHDDYGKGSHYIFLSSQLRAAQG
jgi:hypothetical protein